MLNAGASRSRDRCSGTPGRRPARTWEVDVQQAFNWTREALLPALDPGSVVIAMSSGAAVERLAG